MKYMVGRVIRGIAVRALGPGLSCRRIVLHIDHQGGAFQIRARYLFANRQDVDRIVLLGFDASPSLCDVVVPSGFKLTPPAVSSALGSRVALGLTRSGVSESEEVAVELLYRWSPGEPRDGQANARCLIAPELLYVPSTRPSLGPVRERVAVSCTVRDPGALLVGGVAVDAQAAADYLQVVVVPTDQPAESLGTHSYSPDLVSQLDSWQAGRLGQAASEIAACYQARLGFPLPGRLIFVTPADGTGLPATPGAAIVTEPRQLFRSGRFTTPWLANVAIRIASAWWGAGCAIHGTLSTEMRNGINIALMLSWFDEADPAAFERLHTYYAKLATKIRLPGATALARTRERSDVTARIALTLYGRIVDLGYNSLRGATASYWARSVAGELLAEELGVRDAIERSA